MKKIYDFGLFETMRSFRGRIVYFTEHLNRLKKSASLLKIKFPASAGRLRSMVLKTVKANKFSDAYIKLILMSSGKDTDCLIITKKYVPFGERKYKLGFSSTVSRHRQNDYFLSRIKSVNRYLYERSFDEAKANGFDEALLLNKAGMITECTRSNVFFVKDGRVFTPSLDCGCLEGITRKAVFALAKRNKIRIKEGRFKKEDLLEADEAFLTNSLMGIMPLSSVDGRKIGRGKRKLTEFFMKKYKVLLNGRENN